MKVACKISADKREYPVTFAPNFVTVELVVVKEMYLNFIKLRVI
jgi:hypothetical protein